MNLQRLFRALSIGVFSGVAILMVLPHFVESYDHAKWEKELQDYGMTPESIEQRQRQIFDRYQ